MPIFNNILAGAAGQAGGAAAGDAKSLRFNSGDSSSLNRTFTTTGNRQTWTWSGWVKKAQNGAYQLLFSRPGGPESTIRLSNSDTIEFFQFSGGFTWQLVTTQVFRDPSAWYHLIFVHDSTNATTADRLRIYVNGVRVTAFNTASYPSLNFSSDFNTNTNHTIGTSLNGYLADIHFIDGQALDPTDFGEFDANNVWQPIEYTNTFAAPVTQTPSLDGAMIIKADGASMTGAVSGSGLKCLYTSSNGVDWVYQNREAVGPFQSSAKYLAIGAAGTNPITFIPGNGAGFTYAMYSASTDFTTQGDITVDTTSLTYSAGGTTSYGANGFHLDFNDNSSASALGTDAAGSNDWTVNNIVATTAGPLTSAITAVSNTTTTLSYSAQFVEASSESLSTSQFDANKQAGLFACWMKHEGTGSDRAWIFSAGTTSGAHTILTVNASNKLNFYDYSGGITFSVTQTSAVNLHDGNWHHILLRWDTTQATSTDRVKIWIDGTAETLTGTFPTQNQIQRIGGGGFTHYLADQAFERKYWDCKLAQVVLLNGAQTYTPSDFIEADGRPKTSLSITFGNASSYFTFSNSGNIGANSSGYGNDWTVNGTPTQSTSDTPSKTTSTLTFTDTTNFGLFSVGDAVTQNDDAASGTVYTITSGSSQMAIKDVTGTFATTKQLEGPAAGTAADIDSLFDSPTNGTQTDTGAGGEVSGNYCCWQPLKKTSGVTLSNGNLQVATTGTTIYENVVGTLGLAEGKWYWEVTPTSGTFFFTGIAAPTFDSSNYIGSTADSYGYGAYNGQLRNNGSTSATVSTWAANDVIGIALDMDNGKLYFSKNGTWQGSSDPAAQTNPAYTGLTGTYLPATSGYDTTSQYANFGQRAFAYTAPSGYKALCTANFDTPTIEDPSTVMDVLTWTGDGSSTRTLTGLGFNPDLVWLKSRSVNNDHNLFDSVRGVEKTLSSNLTAAEVNQPIHGYVTAFNSNGFSVAGGSLGDVNYSSRTYAGWNWDAGSTTTPITAGSLTSSLYDQSQTWSNSLTSSTGFRSAPETATSAFDGDTSTIASAVDNGVITFTSPVTFASSSTIRVIVHGGTHNVSVNGGSNQVISAGSFVTLNFTNPSASTFTITFQRTTTADTGVRAIEIGGKLLVDSGVSLSVPSIASSVRANASAGFSIVSWTSNGNANQSIGHGLGVTPSMVLMKSRDTGYNWNCWFTGFTDDEYLVLNGTGQKSTTGGSLWYQTPSSSLIYVGFSGSAINVGNGDKMIAYCFAPVEGYSAFGSYEAILNVNGPFIYTGFRPKWIMIKNVDDTASPSSYGWTIIDTSRYPYNASAGNLNPLYANASYKENSYSDGNHPAGQLALDVLSNGFKLRSANYEINYGQTYIYAAFAENPFKYARAR